MKFTWSRIQRRDLIKLYPYLAPKNAWTGELDKDYDYSYMHGEYDIPEGWQVLFLLYCKNIRPLLLATNYLDKFYFTQVKEKYGTLRLYNGGYPNNFEHITSVYEGFSEYICQVCGKPSKFETGGWIGYFCPQCLFEVGVDEANCYLVKKRRSCVITQHNKGIKTVTTIPYKPLREEYNKCLKMTQDEFFNYLCEVE